MYNLLLDGETSNPASIILIVVMLVAIVALFVFSSISNKKKQKEAQNMVNALKIGDRVKTIGGICGFVAEINDVENTFVLETGTDDKKSYVKFDKGAIYQTAPAQGNCVAAPAEEKKADIPAETAVPAEAKEDKPAEAKEVETTAENVETAPETAAEEVPEQKAEEKPSPKKTATKKTTAKKTVAKKSTSKKTTAEKTE